MAKPKVPKTTSVAKRYSPPPTRLVHKVKTSRPPIHPAGSIPTPKRTSAPNPRAGGGYGQMGSARKPPSAYKTPNETRVARPGPHGGGPSRQGTAAIGRRTSPRPSAPRRGGLTGDSKSTIKTTVTRKRVK